MSLFRRIFNLFSPNPRIDEVAAWDRSKADKVIAIFWRDFFNDVVLPRGTISAIAREAGCSQGYVSRLAKASGYRVGKSSE